jgi:hypothetical protein
MEMLARRTKVNILGCVLRSQKRASENLFIVDELIHYQYLVYEHALGLAQLDE